MINLDKAALNSPHPRFENSISRALSMHRPGSNYLGSDAREFLEDCKARISGHLLRPSSDLSFFGSATAAIQFISRKLKDNHFSFFVPKAEHSCSLSIADYELNVDRSGQPAIGERGQHDAIIISLKNNETGFTPSEKTRADLSAARSRGARIIVDATGGNWKDPLINDADYVFASAGKWHGVSGLGILVGTKDLWDNQATEGIGGVVGGSPNMIGISCLADAMDWIASSHGAARQIMTGEYLSALDEAALELGWQKNGSGARIANYFTGIPSDIFVSVAGEHGLNISAGSACNSGIDQASHVIASMYDTSRAKCSLRFSWDLLTRENDIWTAIKIVKNVHNTLRADLPYGEDR